MSGRVRRALGDPLDLPGPVAVEHGGVLRQGDAPSRLLEPGEVEVVRAALGVVDLAALQHEVGAQLHQGEHAALGAGHVGRRPGDRRDPSERGGRVRPPEGAFEVHELARRQMRLEAGPDLLLDGLPPAVGDGGELSEEVVHRVASFQAPDPERSRRRPTGSRPGARSRFGLDLDLGDGLGA